MASLAEAAPRSLGVGILTPPPSLGSVLGDYLRDSLDPKLAEQLRGAGQPARAVAPFCPP